MGATDLELLHRYAHEGCEGSFAEIVQRHVNLVYGVAMRTLRQSHLAEEVTQSVFLDLARRSGSFRSDTILPAWLHQVARRTAIDAHRREERRRNRERTAMENSPDGAPSSWQDLEPMLDEALATLRSEDRSALVLRYLQGKPLSDVGVALGINEDAAQKRVARAVERLRAALARRGIAWGAAGLTSALANPAVTGAPAALTPAIVSQLAAVVPMSAAGSAWLSLVPFPISGKLAWTAALAAAIGSSALLAKRSHNLEAGLWEARESSARATQALPELETRVRDLTAEVTSLRAQAEELARTRVELMRVRNEIASLREAAAARPAFPALETEVDPASAAIRSWARRVEVLKALPERMPQHAIPELRLLTEEDWIELAKEPLGLAPGAADLDDPDFARRALSAARAKAKSRLMWVLSRALHGFADTHEGRLPEHMFELQPYLMHTNVPGPASVVAISADAVSDDILRRYQVVASGNLREQAEDQPILAEIGPVDADFDTLLQVGNHWVALRNLRDLEGR